jgi:hypothetical protein
MAGTIAEAGSAEEAALILRAHSPQRIDLFISSFRRYGGCIFYFEHP